MGQKTALITGILGQDGAYLAKFLSEQDYHVVGLMRRYSAPNFANLNYLGIADDIEYVSGDMTDEASLMQIVKFTQPDEIYNLAAQSFVGDSWDQPRLTTEINGLGTLYLLNAMKYFAPYAKFYQASTSEMFGGSSDENGQQTEHTQFYPKSPYAISKLYAYWMTINFRESFGLYTTNGILFNHESPIRGKNFVTRKISDGVARIALEKQDTIALGNLDSKRDWGFAGDYVRAMWKMLQQEEGSDYILSTGKSHSIREFLDLAFGHVGIDDWSPYVTTDPRFKRPAEVHTLQGVSDKAKKQLDWEPDVSFEELVKMMVDADLERVKAE